MRVPVNAMSILPSWLDPEVILTSLGPYLLPGLCLIIFAECGLMIGFFLPGDSLLFTAGLFVAQGFIDYPLWVVCALLTVCAFVGNMCGYWIGTKVGPALFSRPDSRLFKQEYVDKTHEFFDKYGPRAIVLARFVPIVRTFITAIAGVGRMDPRKYFVYSAIGGVLWATGVTVLGYFLGQIPFVHENIELMLIVIVLISVIPIAIEFLRARKERKAEVSEPAN
ncbi:DedA family protein [Actinophytocola sp.]|uniref:DedA family protein n=1 Tax=Actinophytocola sp. TaxID=1872138 RepID=UPI002D80A7B6|nr:VTT domain-containing protein [Actinophytocola sp.]HET9140951.1 VTT domain-containing protein [Actinophytocola sp.]